MIWAVLSWKVFGFTDMPSDSSMTDLFKSYKESLSTDPPARVSDIGNSEGIRRISDLESPLHSAHNSKDGAYE